MFRSDDESSDDGSSNNRRGHCVPRQVSQVFLTLSCQEEFIDRKTLHTQGFQSQHRSSSIRNVRESLGRKTGTDRISRRCKSPVHILRQVKYLSKPISVQHSREEITS